MSQSHITHDLHNPFFVTSYPNQFLDEGFNEPSHRFQHPFLLEPSQYQLARTPLFDVDVQENTNNYTVTSDLPGMNKNNISVTVENNVLTVTGNREDNREETGNDGRYTFRERRYGQFSRSIMLEGVTEQGVTAKYTNGVLTVVVPRNGSNVRRTVEIQ
jgi:HSP20 family protein